MGTGAEQLAIQCLRLMLKPLARFCLRHSLRIQELEEAAKIVLIEAAKEEIERSEEKVNISRLSAVTGLHRRDVMRIFREGRTIEEPRNLVSRVIGQWLNDRRFTTTRGTPRVLVGEGEQSEFHKLVRLLSNDVHPGTVLFELERVGAVERTAKGLRLVASGYVPKGNPKEGFELLSLDTGDLICAVDENVFSPGDIPNLHARTEYDKIRADMLPKIREWILEEGSEFHRRLRNYLSQFDLDISPDDGYRGKFARVVVGAFSRIYERDSHGESISKK